MPDEKRYVYLLAEVNNQSNMIVFTLVWKNPCEDMERFIDIEQDTLPFENKDRSQGDIRS